MTPNGLKADPKKVRAMSEFPIPTSVQALQRFLGCIGYYKRFIDGYAATARPLFNLLKKDTEYRWGQVQQRAFEMLRRKISSAPILAYPRFDDRPFILETDASTQGIAGILSQYDDDNVLRPISFVSRTLSAAEKNYTITELELLAVTWSLKTFRSYVLGRL